MKDIITVQHEESMHYQGGKECIILTLMTSYQSDHHLRFK
jgi:hypothetical protein